MTRFVCCLAILAAIYGLAQVPAARCESPSLLTHFQGEPADALIGRLEPGAGFSFTLPETSAEALADRWQLDATDPAEVTATDPATGLVLLQKRRWLADLRLLVLETTLANRGKQAQAVEAVAIADWGFLLRESQDEGYRKLAYRSDVWYDSTYWTGPDWTRVGKNWHHPGVNTPAVRRFTCPDDGRVTITGRVYKLDTKPSDGVKLTIRHRGRTVWQAEIDGPDDKGVEPKVALAVRRGDALRFVVHKRGQIYCDTTHWDPLITYADGRTFQASKGFSTTRQGLGGWSYEMEGDGQTEPGLPRVVGFGPDFGLRDTATGAGQAVTFDDRDALPVFVVADGTDQSGLAIALGGPAGPWRFRASMQGEERLAVELAVGGPAARIRLEPGRSLRLPHVIVGAYQGRWLAGMTRLGKLLAAESPGVDIEDLRAQIASALRRAGAGLDADLMPVPGESPAQDRHKETPALDLWVMLQAEWRREDKITETPDAYATATARHLEKAGTLLADLKREHGPDFLSGEAIQLARLAERAEQTGLSLDDRQSLYQRVRWLKRRIALANPLMDFGKLLFCKRVPTSYSHLVMQFYGWRARPGGGIFVLEDPGRSLACRDLLGGRLTRGNVLQPRLSYDGRRIVFSFVECEGKNFDPLEIHNDVDDGFYHIYEVNVDGSGLRQITRGPYDDLMPAYLPDGGIVFSSTRRRGYARCFGAQFSPRWDVYTLHRVEADGSHLRTLSFHDTNEWFPTVSNTGHVLYARWDYIDRDAVTHQNLWATRPDGTDPVAVWGNATASPHCSFQAQPIPGTGKIIFTAAAHHSIAAGSIAIVDPTVRNNGHEAIRRITPEIPFPEAEGRDIQEYYAAPWPLSETYYLVAYSPEALVWEPGANKRNALGIYLLDAFGNRELIYRDPEIGSTNPCPLVVRPRPPVLASMLPPGAPPTGEMLLADVYQGMGAVPRGHIKQLRIVQIFPKTTPLANSPPIGMAREENARAILGTVPVEPDGSARFIVPAGKPIHFQALDAAGFAYQTMRTVTYVQPGERVSCVGCHENRMTAPVRSGRDVMALRRPPSQIDPGELGGRPFSYVEVVQPVLDKHCVRCHGSQEPDAELDLTGTPEAGFTKSYVALTGDVDFWAGGTNPQNAAKALVPRFGGRNQVQVTPPGGLYGALGSRLMKLLRAGHEDARLTPDELRRLAAWIDLNAIFYGVNLPDAQARQLRGETVAMPEIQ